MHCHNIMYNIYSAEGEKSNRVYPSDFSPPKIFYEEINCAGTESANILGFPANN